MWGRGAVLPPFTPSLIIALYVAPRHACQRFPCAIFLLMKPFLSVMLVALIIRLHARSALTDLGAQ
jgi:hypothetical protein